MTLIPSTGIFGWTSLRRFNSSNFLNPLDQRNQVPPPFKEDSGLPWPEVHAKNSLKVMFAFLKIGHTLSHSHKSLTRIRSHQNPSKETASLFWKVVDYSLKELQLLVNMYNESWEIPLDQGAECKTGWEKLFRIDALSRDSEFNILAWIPTANSNPLLEWLL